MMILENLDIASKTINYIDPGTGSIIVQMLVASFFGGLYALKVNWLKVKNFFKRRVCKK